MKRVQMSGCWRQNPFRMFVTRLSIQFRQLYKRHKRTIFIVVLLVQMLYIFTSLPLRVGLFYDPYGDFDWHSGWTEELTVFSILDAIADIVGIASLYDIFHAKRRAQAAIAADAWRGLVPARARGAVSHGGQRSYGRPQLERKGSLLSRMKNSLLVAWSLNSIIPAAMHNYDIRRPLLLELVAIMPFEFLAFIFGPNALHILRVTKLLRLHRVSECFSQLKKIHARTKIMQVLDYTGNTVLVKTVLKGFALCHWLACGYLAIAHLQCGIGFRRCVNEENTTAESSSTCWAIEDQLVGGTRVRLYARALYWSSRTLITLGYYDVASVTNIETLYVIFAQVLGAIFSTSVLATFLFIFRHRNSHKQDFMAQVDNAKEYMKLRRFPEDVREAVLSYFKNVWTTHHGLYQGEVIERLPEHLRVSVFSVLKVQRIQKVVFLTKESVEFINTLALKMVHCVYSPKDWIIEKIPDGMYFVLRGNVMLESVNQTRQRFAKAGDYFAESALLYAGRAEERARAQRFCELYKLPQSAFYNTVAIFYRNNAPIHLERMRSMHVRRDQQEQKMKRMLGRSAEYAEESTGSMRSGLNTNSRMAHRRNDWRMPGSSFRKWWEHARLVCLTFVAFEVPFYNVFNTSTLFPSDSTLKLTFQLVTAVTVEVFFWIDFLFRCRYFAYIDALAMIPVNDPSYIFEAFKTNGMWLDLIAILPVPLVMQFVHTNDEYRIGPIFRFSRLLRIRYIPHLIQEVSHLRGWSSKVQRAITLFISVTLAIHVTGCLWFQMASFNLSADPIPIDIEENITRDSCLQFAALYGNCSWVLFDTYGQVDRTFIIHDPGSDYTPTFAYLRSVYWAIVALTTVGYGDIVAFSTVETYFAAFWVFIGGIINYGVVGAMSNIISNLTAMSRHHSETMNVINLVLAHFRISENVRVQIRRYYHQQFYVQKVSSEAKLLCHLPYQLRHRISLILHSESVKKVPLFVGIDNERLLNDLTGLFRRRIYQRGDTFFPDNNVCDEMYVIVSGRVNMFSKSAGTVPVGALTDGDCYGVCEMLLHKNFNTSLVAASVVDVSVITRNAFASTIERRYGSEVQKLRQRALQQQIFDTLSLEAIINNIKTGSTLAKFTEDCTSMFAEKEDWVHHQKKMRLRFYWDTIVFFLNVYNAFQITFRIAFLHHPAHGTRLGLVLMDFFGDSLLVTDVYLKLYYFECESGLRNLLTRAEKDSSYVEHWLKKDLWSCLPLFYVGDNFFVMSLCRIPRLLRILQIPETIDSLIMRVQQRFSTGGNISAYLSPVHLVLILLFAAHFAACGFYLISETDHNENSWLHHDHVVHQEHESVGVLYLRAFYWALTTLTLVGSREIVPLGIPGTLWASITCLCCTFIVGHIVGELSEVILELDKTKKELKERESHFEQFAKDHNLPTSIRARVLHYLKFQHSYLKGMDIHETFRDLSSNLRVQLMLDLYGDTIRNLCIAPYLNQAQINGLAVRVKSELFIPGDTIIVEGDLGHKLFIVKCGTAMVLWKSTGTAVATVNAGSVFGEVAFFLSGQRRIATVQATTCSEMLVLTRHAWDDLLNSSQRDEAEATERALIKWVRECLSGYNIMTVEIVKDIKFGEGAPPTMDQLRAMNVSSIQAMQKQLPAQRGPTLKRSSTNTLQEKKVRHLLKKGLHQNDHANEGQGTYHDVWQNIQDAGRRVLHGLVGNLTSIFNPRMGKTGNLARIYASVGDISGNGDKEEPATESPLMRVLEHSKNPVVKRTHALPLGNKANGEAYRVRNANGPLPLIKQPSFKNGTATQINPVSRSMREYYSDAQLAAMEDECWRRYKVSILLVHSFSDHTPGLVENDMSKTKSPSFSSSPPSDHLLRMVEGRGLGAARKIVRGSTLVNINRRGLLGNSVTSDGMRCLANYRTSSHKKSNNIAPTRQNMTARKSFSQAATSIPLISETDRKRRKRKLKRSQSLPIFDQHYAVMIEEELRDSNSKDHESKLNLGFELLQRCQQPEFSYLFQLYVAWLEKKAKWNKSYQAPQTRKNKQSARLLVRQPSMFSVRGHGHSLHAQSTKLVTTERKSSNVNKAEDFLKLLSRCYRLWECLVVIVAAFYALSLPFLICFTSRSNTLKPYDEELTRYLRLVGFIDAFCVFDLILTYTAFQGVLHMQIGGEGIASSSVSLWGSTFLLDLVAALPIDILLFLPQMHAFAEYRWYYLGLFQLNKILRIYQSIEATERLAQFLATDLSLPFDDGTLRFARSVGGYLVAGHWIGCMWFRASLYAYETYHSSWISTSEMLAQGTFTSLAEISTTRRYLRSLHFAIGSITTVFYGDIASLNMLETLVEIGVILLSIFIFGILVGAQGERIEALYKRRMLFEQNLKELYHFLANNEVPRDIRHRLKLYYTNTWLKYHGHDDFEGVAGLSTLLVEDIAQYTLRSFASKVSILKSCDECFLRSLLTCLKHVICSASEAVVRKGDVDRSMYFIARGKVLVQGAGFELVKEAGDFFGELSLLYGIPRSATCSSLGTSLLYVLEWETYEKLLVDFPEYREQNRREWVIVSTVLQTGDTRFRSIINIVAKMEKTNWVTMDEIIRKAKSLK